MFGLVPSAMEEGTKGPQNCPKGHGGPKGPQPFAGARRRGAERTELLVYYNILPYTTLQTVSTNFHYSLIVQNFITQCQY